MISQSCLNSILGLSFSSPKEPNLKPSEVTEATVAPASLGEDRNLFYHNKFISPMTPSKRKTLIDEIWKTRKLSDQDSEDPIFLLYWLNVDPRPKESHDLVYEGTGFSKSN